MTLPNAFSLKRLMGAILLRQERNNPDHMYFFSTMTLEQAAYRFGYELREVSGFMYYAPEAATKESLGWPRRSSGFSGTITLRMNWPW